LQSYSLACGDKLVWLGQILAEVPMERAEWILWVDMDIILADTTFNFPFSDYIGKDVVIWGDQEYITQGDPRRGANPSPFANPPLDHHTSMSSTSRCPGLCYFLMRRR
jgi:hypothetical protein